VAGDVFIGWVAGDEAQSTVWTFGLLKEAATLSLDIASPAGHLPVLEAAIRAFHITMNSPLLQSASSE